MATLDRSLRQHEWENYPARTKFTASYKYDERSQWGLEFVILTPETEKYIYNKKTLVEYTELKQTIKTAGGFITKSVKARRIKSIVISSLTAIIIFAGIGLLALGAYLYNELYYGAGVALIIVGILICVIGCLITCVVSSLFALYERINSPLKKATKFLERESIKKYQDCLGFEVEKYFDEIKEWRTRKVPVGTPAQGQPQQYRTERYQATVKWPVYYVHVTNKFPPTAEEEAKEGFFYTVPNIRGSQIPPGVKSHHNAVPMQQAMPVQQMPVQQMPMQQMPVQQMPMEGMPAPGPQVMYKTDIPV